MGRKCEVCGKGPRMGNKITTRGKAKYLGGVGTKVTGIARREFKPNLQKVSVFETRPATMMVESESKTPE